MSLSSSQYFAFFSLKTLCKSKKKVRFVISNSRRIRICVLKRKMKLVETLNYWHLTFNTIKPLSTDLQVFCTIESIVILVQKLVDYCEKNCSRVASSSQLCSRQYALFVFELLE